MRRYYIVNHYSLQQKYRVLPLSDPPARLLNAPPVKKRPPGAFRAIPERFLL